MTLGGVQERSKGGAPQRIALGWDRPMMRAAAEWLAREFPPSDRVWDLTRVTVVTQGGRAGRIFEAMVVDVAAELGVGVAPPRRISPGELAELAVGPAPQPASDLVRGVAWEIAIKTAPAEAVRAVMGAVPASPSHLSAVAEMLDTVHRELAGACARFGDVPALAEALPGFEESERWHGAERIRERYLAVLAADGWVDAGAWRMERMRAGEVRTHADPVVLVGIVDMPEVGRRALERCATDVRSLVFAPEELLGHFDAWGRPGAWWSGAHASAVTHEVVRFADGPRDQAEAAVEALAELAPSPRPEEVVIGVPDAAVVPPMRRWLAEMEAFGRPAAGTLASRTRPVRALSLIADAVEDASWEPFAAMVRHPDVMAWVDRRVPATEASWLAALDAHGACAPSDALGCAEGVVDEEGELEIVRAVLGAVTEMVEGVRGSGERRVSAWCGPIAAVVERIYGDAGVVVPREVDAALAEIGRALLEMSSLAGTGVDVVVPAARALRMCAEAAGGASIPEPPREDAVDLVGWLELAADPASVVIVTGMNEGSVPSSVVHEPMVPDRLRRAVGLVDDAARLARDCYLAELIARQGRRVRFIVGHRSADGDPLAPSRVIVRGDPARVPEWVERFTSGGRDRYRTSVVRARVRSGSDGFPVRPMALQRRITSMRVTAFRQYLESPYLFYVFNVLNLGEAGDAGRELDPASFGTLVHKALHRFAAHPAGTDGDAARVERGLMECLDAAAGEMLGREPVLAARIQVELARGRLRRMAASEARRRAEGWMIERTEWTAQDREGKTVVLDVDGEPMGVRARIDRIERHERTGRWAIIDFKTGESAKDPESAHRTKRDKQWVDLQLPLYAHLASSIVGEEVPMLGYGAVNSDVPEDAFKFAEWTRADLDDALERARDVVRAIRRGEFGDAGRGLVYDPVTGALLRVDRERMVEGVEDAGAGEGGT